MSDFLSYICMNTLRGELSSAMRRGLKKEILWLLECKGMDRLENTYSWYFMFFRMYSVHFILEECNNDIWSPY